MATLLECWIRQEDDGTGTLVIQLKGLPLAVTQEIGERLRGPMTNVLKEVLGTPLEEVELPKDGGALQ